MAEVHLTPSEFTPQEHTELCPAKDDSRLDTSFGLAGGGFGVYAYCMVCFAIRTKECLADDED